MEGEGEGILPDFRESTLITVGGSLMMMPAPLRRYAD